MHSGALGVERCLGATSDPVVWSDPRFAERPTGQTVGPRRHPSDRDYFDRLGDGLVMVLEPEEAERVNEKRGGAWSTEGGAWLHVGAGGMVTAFTGKVDLGQDNPTALTLLGAEELRVPVEAVELVMGDTDFCPADIGTFGSRSIEDAGGVLRARCGRAYDWLRREGGGLSAAGRGRIRGTRTGACDTSIR